MFRQGRYKTLDCFTVAICRLGRRSGGTSLAGVQPIFSSPKIWCGYESEMYYILGARCHRSFGRTDVGACRILVINLYIPSSITRAVKPDLRETRLGYPIT